MAFTTQSYAKVILFYIGVYCQNEQRYRCNPPRAREPSRTSGWLMDVHSCSSNRYLHIIHYIHCGGNKRQRLQKRHFYLSKNTRGTLKTATECRERFYSGTLIKLLLHTHAREFENARIVVTTATFPFCTLSFSLYFSLSTAQS